MVDILSLLFWIIDYSTVIVKSEPFIFMYQNRCIIIEPISDVVVPLIVAVIGASVGAYFGLRFARNWDREKRKEEIAETRNHVIGSLITEATSNKEQLSLPAAQAKLGPSGKLSIGIFVLGTEVAFQSAVNSGNFSLLPPDIQTRLGALYSRLEVYNTFTLQIQNWNTNIGSTIGDATEAIRQIITHREQLRNDILHDLQLIIQELQNSRRVCPPRRWWHLKNYVYDD
jgi:hypothetical protein